MHESRLMLLLTKIYKETLTFVSPLIAYIKYSVLYSTESTQETRICLLLVEETSAQCALS
jgi:hypothetical protein